MLKYEQIIHYIRQKAEQADKDEKLPTVRAIADELSASTATVMRAIQELERQNVIIRRLGSGIFAVKQSPNRRKIVPAIMKAPYVVLANVDYPSENIWYLNYQALTTLYKNGFQVLPRRISWNDSILSLCREVEKLKNCAGLIISGIITELDDKILQEIGHLPFRVVLLNHLYQQYKKLPQNCLLTGPDGIHAISLATECLVKHGHSRIGFVMNEPNLMYYKNQANFLIQNAQKLKIDFTENEIFSRDIRSWDDSASAARFIIEQDFPRVFSQKITALYFASSNGALAAISALKKHNVSIPDNISIISEGEYVYCNMMAPRLTTVSTDYLQMIDAAIQFIKGTAFAKQICLSPQKLIERESIASLSSY